MIIYCWTGYILDKKVLYNLLKVLIIIDK